jgi:KDO2-lipid IV(A) lauroyltransferase
MIRASVENGHKVLILGSHFYNWEWIGVVMPKYLGLKCVAVYKPLSNSFVNKVARRVRQRFGMTLAAMGEVISFLKNDSSQKVYLMIADQSPSIHDEANDLVFLDRMTSFFKGSDKIANRFNLKVYFQSVNKVDDRYYVNFFPLDADVKFIEVYAAYLQSDIARSPEGWLWSHKRWKRQKIYS